MSQVVARAGRGGSLGALLLLGVVGGLCGCGSRRVVSGNVTCNRVSAPGEASFIAGDGNARSGVIGSDGRYEVADPPVGQVTIVVVATRAERKSPRVGLAVLGKAGATAVAVPIVRSLIPTRYNDPKTSGLTFVVGKGRQSHNIELEGS